MMTIARTGSLCALMLWLGACEKSNPPASPPASAAAPLPSAPSAPARPAADGSVTGKVLETMDSGGYTYVRIAAATGEHWAAVSQTKVAVGDTVTISNAMVMRNFESKTLGRTFDEILFGTLAGAAEPAPAAAPAAKGKIALDAPIAKADGPTGRTVAEVFAGKADLADKPVAIRGKVTKFNADIMGKNWVHLQDGSGDPAQGNFDLTVTTSATAAVGDVVLVRGTVRVNKDFGAGYAYDVIVEDATLERP